MRKRIEKLIESEGIEKFLTEFANVCETKAYVADEDTDEQALYTRLAAGVWTDLHAIKQYL